VTLVNSVGIADIERAEWQACENAQVRFWVPKLLFLWLTAPNITFTLAALTS
jgi:hypothetical protein